MPWVTPAQLDVSGPFAMDVSLCAGHEALAGQEAVAFHSKNLLVSRPAPAAQK